MFKCWKCLMQLVDGHCANTRCSYFGERIKMGSAHDLPDALVSKIGSSMSSYKDLARFASTDKWNYMLAKRIRAVQSHRQIVGDSVQMDRRVRPIEDKYTYHHQAMARLDTLASGKRAAMLVMPNSKLFFVAFDASHEVPGHTPVVNLVQHVLDGDPGVKKVWDKIKGCYVYVNYWPTESDFGICVQQLMARNDRIICPDPEEPVIYMLHPVKENRRGLLQAFKAEPSVTGNKPKAAAAEMELEKQEKLIGPVISGTPSKQFSESLERKDGRVFLIPNTQRLRYPNLSREARQLFDDICLLTAFVLGSALFDRSEKELHTVGALLVNEEGDILSWGLDESATIHAETSTIKLLAQVLKKEPSVAEQLESCRVYTSLEPCFMCAGLLAEFGKQRKLTIVYGQVDPAVHEVYSEESKQRVEAEPTAVMWHAHINALLDEAPYARPTSGTQGAISSTTTAGFATQLEQKRQRLDELHKQSLEGQEGIKETVKNKYANSVMQALGQPAYRRRFLKALFRLVDLAPRLQAHTRQNEQEFLVGLWKNSLELLMRVRDQKLDKMLETAAELLMASQGKHPYKHLKPERVSTTQYSAEASRCQELYQRML
jgi:tRNA(Arg) A34 adenosine deaminase TadA